MNHPLTQLVAELRKRGVTQKATAKALGLTEPALSRALANATKDIGHPIPLTWAYRLAQFAADQLPEKLGVPLKFPAIYAPGYYNAKWKCQSTVKRERAAKAAPVVAEVAP